MKFNPSKCTILTVSNSQSPLSNLYHLSGTALSHVDDAKYLGVTLSKDLKWSKHIQSVTSRCCSTLGLLRRNLYMCPMELRERAYFALVRSRLEYAAAAWDPYLKKDVKALEAVQRRAARFTKGDYGRTSSVDAMLEELGWLALKDRRRDIRLAFLFQLVRGKVAGDVEDWIIPADTRARNSHPHKLRPFNAKKDTLKESFVPRTITDWNSLPEACVSADTITAFKAQLRPCVP